MAVELKVPPVGESIVEVQIGDWLVAEGESVNRDDIIVKIETDKVTVDLPAPVTGVISQIKMQKGETANVGDVIGFIEERASVTTNGGAKVEAKPSPAAPPEPAEDEEQSPASQSNLESLPAQGFARVMPSARRALKERGLQAEDIQPTGPGGRLLKEDVLKHQQPEPARPAPARPAPAQPAPAQPAPARPAAARPSAPSAPVGDRHEDAVPMSPFRKRVAERLVQSQQTAALLTTFNEVDMSAVMDLRKQYQESFQERYGIKLGFMSFFVKAVIDALKLVPAVNAEIRGSDIVYKNYYDIGVAVGGGKGLAVPIIRNAERMSFAEIEQKIADFGKRAKDNKLELQELQGGTFTISNGGIYGSMLSTPIVNPPQSGILGLHNINDRPVALNGQVVIRPMMYLALTYDHRLIDGREAVTFLKRIKHCIEQPSRILLEV